MNTPALLDVWQGAIATLIQVGGPFLLISLAVGIFTSVLQAATQLQENLLSFAPKVVAILGVLIFGGSWVMGHLVNYFQEAAQTMERLGGAAGL